MRRRVLVTGGVGFVGSHVVRACLSEGWQVAVPYQPENGLAQIQDILDQIQVYPVLDKPNEVFEIFKDFHPELVFHLASVFIAKHEPEDVFTLVNANIAFGAQIFEAMSKTGVRFMVNTGTSWQHYRDEDYNPVNLYAATKQAFEDILAYYVQTGRVEAITLKLFDTYGPADPHKKLFHLLAHAADQGTRLEMSPGEQMIDLVYIDDVVKAFLMAAKRLLDKQIIGHECYAVSSVKPVSLRDLAEIYQRVTGKALNIIWGGRPYRDREVMLPWSRGKCLPGWSPEIDLIKGISMVVNK